MKDLSGLNGLLKASSKSVVEKLLNLVFISRNQTNESCVSFFKTSLELDSLREAEDLYSALLECVEVSLASGSVEPLAELFKISGKEVNSKLKQLVGQTIENRLDSWKEAAALDRLALPRLKEFDWALHFKKASNEVSSMNAASVVVALSTENQPENSYFMPKTETVQFELSREALETMIDGLGKIRDQLSQMG